jgi:hypothetical protein
MESTMVNSFIRASRLRSWVERPYCPPAIMECKKLLDKLDFRRNTDSYKDDELDSTEDTSFPAKYRQGKFTYGKSSYHLGNSLIQFYPNGEQNTSPIAGCINSIELAGHDVFFHVHRFLPAHGMSDPFRHYPYFNMKMYSSNQADETECIPFKWVLSHIALCPFSSDLVVTISLSRVSNSTLVFFYI